MLVCLILFISAFDSVLLQGNIFEFSPNQPHCLGEEVTLTCYLFPTSQAYRDFALISFNQSAPETVGTINAERASFGYSATVAIPLMGSSARIQLTIASFQESDNNTLFGCHAELASNGSNTEVIESGYPPIAGPPSQPVVSVSPTNCTYRVISWVSASDRDIDRYYLYRDGTLLTDDITDTQFVDRDQLMVDTNYSYSVVANSCAGNSSEGAVFYTIKGYGVDSNAPIFISYNDSTYTVGVNWTLNTNPGAPPLLLTYSLNLMYSYTQADMPYSYRDSSSFSLLSDVTTHSVVITAPSFSTNDSVIFNITACVNITEQCESSFVGETVCGSYSTESTTPPTTGTQTTPQSVGNTTTAVASSQGTATPLPGVPNIPAAVIGAVVVVVIIFCGCSALITVIILVIVCLKKKGQGSSKRSNLENEGGETKDPGGRNRQNIEMKKEYPPKRQELLYADLDLVASRTGEVSQTVEETHYTAVRPLMDGPRK